MLLPMNRNEAYDGGFSRSMVPEWSSRLWNKKKKEVVMMMGGYVFFSFSLSSLSRGFLVEESRVLMCSG